jgi:hypothetical protein
MKNIKINPKKKLARKMMTFEERRNKRLSPFECVAWLQRKTLRKLKAQKLI